MSSDRQIEANRRNSQFSTGPRTPEGKAVSRFNALKSGIHAKSQVVPGEDPAELEALAEGYHQDWGPTTHLECFLVDSLIRADWLLRRLARIEAETWTHEIEEARKSVFSKLDEDAPLGHIYGRTDDRFTRLQRRIDSTERSYYRALTQLQRLRAGGDFDRTNPIPPDSGIRLPPCPGEQSSPDSPRQNEPIPPPLPPAAATLSENPVPRHGPAAIHRFGVFQPRVSSLPRAQTHFHRIVRNFSPRPVVYPGVRILRKTRTR